MSVPAVRMYRYPAREQHLDDSQPAFPAPSDSAREPVRMLPAQDAVSQHPSSINAQKRTAAVTGCDLAARRSSNNDGGGLPATAPAAGHAREKP